MKRGWFLLLALSLGLNAGLLYVQLSDRDDARRAAPPRGRAPGGPGRVSGAARERLHADWDPHRLIERHLGRMARRFDLESTQGEQIRGLLAELLPKIVAHREQVGELRRAVADLYAQPEMDPHQFRELTRQLNAAQRRLDSLVTEAMLEEAAVLTPEQRQQFARELPWGHRSADAPAKEMRGSPRERRHDQEHLPSHP